MTVLIQNYLGPLLLMTLLGLFGCNAEAPVETSEKHSDPTGGEAETAGESEDGFILRNTKTALDKAKGVEATINNAERARGSQLDDISQ